MRSESDEQVSVNLTASKSKIAPMKQITIPRLELCAAQMGAQLAMKVKDTLKLSVPISYWTDSQVVL